MGRSLVVFIFGFSLLVSLPGHADSSNRGKAVYSTTCVVCHGPDGKGAIPGVPDFTKKGGALEKSNELLLDHMINGFQSDGSPMAMPARGGNPSFTDQDMEEVLKYIRATFEQGK